MRMVGADTAQPVWEAEPVEPHVWVFTGPKRFPESGLWLTHSKSGARHLLIEGDDVGSGNWSPDGRTLAAPVDKLARFQPGNSSKVGLYFLNVPELPATLVNGSSR